jgi:hypothetical protein
VVNTSGELPRAGDSNIARQIQQLNRLTIPDLKVKYGELFGEQTRVTHKQFLVRRIAWQLQANAQGNLSERARRRIAELAGGTEPKSATGKLPQSPVSPTRQLQSHPDSPRDPRLPPPGAFIQRIYQGREIVVKVLEHGFEYDSERYTSLSALARQLTGTRWNGLLFFGLAERRHE